MAAVQQALPEWMNDVARTRMPAGAFDEWGEEWAQLVDDVCERIVSDLTELLGCDFDRQRTSPLAVLRSVVGPLTDFLRRVGAEPVARDDGAVALHPDDIFELTPGAFADFGPEVGDAGLRWGAAKAFVHLRSRSERVNGGGR